jgi:hypothetical protein
MVLDDLLVLYELAYKYRCLWDSCPYTAFDILQENAQGVVCLFSNFVQMSGKGWTVEQFNHNLKELVDKPGDGWACMMDFMIREAGCDNAKSDRSLAYRTTQRVFAYAKTFSSAPALLDTKLATMQHKKREVAQAEA